MQNVRHFARRGDIKRLFDSDQTVTSDWTFSGAVTFSNTASFDALYDGSTDHKILLGPNKEWELYVNQNGALVFNIPDDDAGVLFSRGSGLAAFQISNVDDRVWVRDGYKLRVSDSADTNFAEFYHDGTNFNTDLTSSGTWVISGSETRFTSALQINGSTAVKFALSGGTPSCNLVQGAYDGRADVLRFRQGGTGGSNVGFAWSNFDTVANTIWIQPGTKNTIRSGSIDDEQPLLLDASKVLFNDGSAAGPSITFDSDSDTGIYLSATDRVGFAVGGVLQGEFWSNGFVLRSSGGSSLYMAEKAAANADSGGHGQLWVKNTTPCELWFTDDAGNDHQIAFV